MAVVQNRCRAMAPVTTGANFVALDSTVLDVSDVQLAEYVVTMADATCAVQVQSRTYGRDANNALVFGDWSIVTTIDAGDFPGVGSHRIPVSPFGDQIRVAVKTIGGTDAEVVVAGRTYPPGQLTGAIVKQMIEAGIDFDEAALVPQVLFEVRAIGGSGGEVVKVEVNEIEVKYTTVAGSETKKVIAEGFRDAFLASAAADLKGIVKTAVADDDELVVTFHTGVEIEVSPVGGDLDVSAGFILQKPAL